MRERIKVQISKGKQDWSYRGIWRVNGRIVRIDIKRDAFDFQCRALSHLLHENGKWSPQAKIPYSLIASLRSIDSAAKAVEEAQFEADVNTLLDEAELFLGGPLQLWILILCLQEGVIPYPVYSLDKESLPDPMAVICAAGKVDINGSAGHKITWFGPFPNTGVGK